MFLSLMTLANDSHMVRFQIDTIAKKQPQSNATMQDAQTMNPAGYLRDQYERAISIWYVRLAMPAGSS